MVREIENIFLATFFASLLMLAKSSSGNPFQNELLEELKTELKSLRLKVDLLEARNIENVDILAAKITQQEEEIGKLRVKIDSKQDTCCHAPFINDREIHRNNKDNKMSSAINKRESLSGYSSTRASPSSCRELSFAGHSLDGLYLVKNQETKKIETVLCTFGTVVSQDFIGNVDVKTKTVHFYVQRESIFEILNAVIPFELAPVNEGNAFNLTSGIFTVPVTGIYHVQFSAVKSSPVDNLFIFLQVNGVNFGLALTDQLSQGSRDVVSLSASLRLEAGNRVNLYLQQGVLYDNIAHYSHFSGWLVEEDLM